MQDWIKKALYTSNMLKQKILGSDYMLEKHGNEGWQVANEI
jgi:hypothetical protein